MSRQRTGRKYKLDEVLPYVLEWHKKKGFSQKKEFDGHLIKMNTDTLRTYKIHGVTCSVCGLKGQIFYKEKAHADKDYHFNLYGVCENGKEIQFTKDHIIPRALGGGNGILNLQPMCWVCNQKKGIQVDPNRKNIDLAEFSKEPLGKLLQALLHQQLIHLVHYRHVSDGKAIIAKMAESCGLSQEEIPMILIMAGPEPTPKPEKGSTDK